MIDPEGKLVGEAGEDALAEKLPPLPMSVRVVKALDRGIGYRMEDPQLEYVRSALSGQGRVPIRLDVEDLKADGITPSTTVPFTMTGSISLRSWLNLLLEADGLTYEQDEKGIVIRRHKAGAPPLELSPVQRACAHRIEKVLDQKISFDFKEKPLSEVARFFENKTQENFVLSPRDRKAGLLDPKMLVTGSAKDVPLREALTKLLGPLGVDYTIRDEVVVLTAKPKAASR